MLLSSLPFPHNILVLLYSVVTYWRNNGSQIRTLYLKSQVSFVINKRWFSFPFNTLCFFSQQDTCFKTAAPRDIERASVLQSCSRVQGPPRPAPSSAPWQVRCPCVMYSGIMSKNNRIFIYISIYIHLYLYHIYMLIELV